MKTFIYTIILSFIISIPLKSQSQTLYTSYVFKGTIGTNPIVLTFLVPDHFYNFNQGHYYYEKQKKRIEFRGPLFETIGSNGKEKIIEVVNGKQTGYFIFTNLDVIESKKITGNWFTMDGKNNFPVNLNLEKIKTP